MNAEEVAPLLAKARDEKALREAEYPEGMTADEWRDVVARLVDQVIVNQDKTIEVLAKIGS
jgi:hypothetical protein